MKQTCSGFCHLNKGGGWSFDPETRYWVCGGCRKPAPWTLLRWCGICEELYSLTILQPNTGTIELDHEECVKELAKAMGEPDDSDKT